MNSKFNKKIALIFALSLAVGLTACGGNKKTATNAETNKLTYWVPLNPNAAMSVSNYGETPFSKELQKKFNVQIEYQHPPQGKEAEKFNIMISMGELPDIIEYQWMTYPGGPAKAMVDGVIKELDLKDKAPNLYAYTQSNQEVNKLIKTDNGKYFSFPFIRGDRMLQTSAGLVIRKDWLDDLGMQVPETLDDWEKVLTAFKEKKNAKYPLSFQQGSVAWGTFIGAFGTMDGLYLDNGTVKYGALEPGFREYLALMNKWYKSGLIPTDFSSIDAKTVDSNILNGFSGATTGSVGSGIGRWMSAAKESGYSLVAAPYPVINRGDKPEFGQMQLKTPGTFTAISRDCKNVDLAMKILDFGYSQEGQMFFNFGIEGESYNMTDGYPKYTDIICKNPEGLSMSAAMARYLQAYNEGPFIQDKRYMEQYASLPQQKDACKTWSATNMEKHLLPNISLTPEQTEVYAKKISSIDTFKSEMVVKFIMGIEPISNYDSFIAELKTRGIVDYLGLMQEAYERYSNR